jgi:uncharacterized phage protein (TIGR01671 family)
MREIKFRGLNGEKWLYGDLDIDYKTKQATISDDRWWRHPVRFDTVGQFTGLKDSNGKEIYEGDIVEISPQFSAKQGLKRKFHLSAVVRWDERLARFVVISKEILNSIPDSECVSVIGNIYDNPSLLEAKGDGI